MPKAPKRQQAVKKFNLADQTLRINLRKCNYDKFKFSEIEDYVRELVGDREYQFQAIKEVMTYLWGGGYNSVEDLARENFNDPERDYIRKEHGNLDLFLSKFPLRDKLSGVVHMATGTGKSYVIFAVAYLSILMGFVKKVFVLGPPSLVIEQGLREKFDDLMRKKELIEKLSNEHRGIKINLLTDNDAIEDYSIVVENINAVWGNRLGSINDWFSSNSEDVLVLSDEIHHAYSHLSYDNTHQEILLNERAKKEEKEERLWMKFLKENKQIKRHIGFTGTPYNNNDFFADVIFDYSIRTAIDEKYIKAINPLIKVNTEEGDDLSSEQRYEVIFKNHLENKEKYSYKDKDGLPRVKPITIFICSDTKKARLKMEEFIDFLIKKIKKDSRKKTKPELRDMAIEKVILVTSNNPEKEYKDKLNNIEEVDCSKVGGKVEFIFAVNKLSEGWDVENVFQIVPMEEKAFNSKLLISQVLGRGLRIPKEIPKWQIEHVYPRVTITNHEKFADTIMQIFEAVIQSDMQLTSAVLPFDDMNETWRGNKNFTVFNLNYIPKVETEERDDKSPNKYSETRELKLTSFEEKENVRITYLEGDRPYTLERNTITVDQIVADISRRFRSREHEVIRFNFGKGEQVRCPTEEEIRDVIIAAKDKANIVGNKLSEENKQQINLYFNQYLPSGKERRVFKNIEGDIVFKDTIDMGDVSLRVSELSHDASVFLSENYCKEVGDRNKNILEYISKSRTSSVQNSLFADINFLIKDKEKVRNLVEGDCKSPFIVNSSIFKNPQSFVIASHVPERDFVLNLLNNYEYIDAWIKSRDMNFYSLGYEFWKNGKDRIRRSFNPDFFIKINIERYMGMLENTNEKEKLFVFKKLQEKGIKEIIRVVEIKSDDDRDEATPAKEKWAKDHFKILNKKLLESGVGNLPSEYILKAHQYYTFDLLTPIKYFNWFESLKKGVIEIDSEFLNL